MWPAARVSWVVPDCQKTRVPSVTVRLPDWVSWTVAPGCPDVRLDHSGLLAAVYTTRLPSACMIAYDFAVLVADDHTGCPCSAVSASAPAGRMASWNCLLAV